MSFADAFIDVNPAVEGGCVIDPVTRFISGSKGVLGTTNLDYQNVAVNEDTSPYIDGGAIYSPVEGFVSLDAATVTHSSTTGGTVVDGSLKWTRSSAGGMFTFAFDLPVAAPAGQVSYLYLDTTFNVSYSTLLVTFFNASGSQIGTKSINAYSYSAGRRGFVLPLAPPSEAARMSVRHSRQDASAEIYSSDSYVHKIAFCTTGQLSSFSPWHAPGTKLLEPDMNSPVGGVRFVGPGRFSLSVPPVDDNAGFRLIKSSDGVVVSSAFAGGSWSGVRPLEGTSSRLSDTPNWSNVGVASWAFGVLLEGESVEYLPSRAGGYFGWEWEGEQNNSRSLANTVKDGFLELGVGRGTSLIEGDFSVHIDAVAIQTGSDDFWAVTVASREVDGYRLYGLDDRVPLDGLYPVTITRSSGVITMHLPSGPVVLSAESGPPDFALAAGMKVRRYAVWNRALTPAEVEGLSPVGPMTVRWEPAVSDGGSPVVGYKVFFVRGGVLVSEVVGPLVREFVLENYSGPVAVSAINAVGAGTPVEGVASVGS